MLQVTRRVIIENAVLDATLSLPYELRQKSRLRSTLDNGIEVGLMLPRGSVLKAGDILQAEDGRLIGVFAAAEEVTTARSDDALTFAKACYHLGNRHTPLQISNGWLRYRRDHVLDDMVQMLGLTLIHERAAFEPESGAYAGGHHHG